MNKILLPVDGSDCALRAVKQAISLVSGGNAEVHLLNVQPALPADVSRFIKAEDIKGYHQDEAKKEMATAVQALNAAGVKYQTHIVVGDPAPSIARFAEENGVTQIIMGTHGRTGLAGVVLGSVAAKTLHLAKVPVLVVK